MTDKHKELCERLREEIALFKVARINPGQIVPALAMIEQQAARIQQQALEYVSLFDQCSEHLARIAELEADRDCWRDQCAQRVADWDEMRKERDALKADAERWRIIESTLPTDELQDIAIIVAAEHSVNVANGFSRTPTDLLDTAITTLQAEKETRS